MATCSTTNFAISAEVMVGFGWLDGSGAAILPTAVGGAVAL